MIALRTLLLSALVACSVVPLAAHAQDVSSTDVDEVRGLERCITEHQTHLHRLVALIHEAEGRASSSDAAVAHDVRAHLELCIRDAQIPGPRTSTEVVHEAHPSGSPEDHVSSEGDTVQEIHGGEPIGTHVRVVRGERVDGRGTVPHEDLRRAVRATGAALDRCYASYVDRASAREGSVELSFAAVDGAIREVAVESVGPFDAALRTCVVQAVSAMQLHHTSGRTVFAYVISLGS